MSATTNGVSGVGGSNPLTPTNLSAPRSTQDQIISIYLNIPKLSQFHANTNYS
ncbi:hypothetical protein ALT761_02557 [Alteromonas sp. 76-1]|nr:hypothetical protein ALT761_02557 [Alteromonas sp. 76-1]